MIFSVDILTLLSKGNYVKWNEFLTDCLMKNDINRLAQVRKDLQINMAQLAKKNLNSERINVFFCRLITSIEKTARRIIKKIEPNPKDDPMIAKAFGKEFREIKRKRDMALDDYFKRTSH